MAFVRAEEQATPTVRRRPTGIPTSVRDCELLVDLEKQLKSPSHIAAATMGSDIIINLWPDPSDIWESMERGRGEPLAVPPKQQREEILELMVASELFRHKLWSDQPQLGSQDVMMRIVNFYLIPYQYDYQCFSVVKEKQKLSLYF